MTASDDGEDKAWAFRTARRNVIEALVLSPSASVS
jgi:hypothetical protein